MDIVNVNSKHMPIYTRTGDTGETALFGGKRVPKSNVIVDAYGSIDELNSSLGIVQSLLKIVEVQEFLRVIQSDLFVAGAVLAGGNDDISQVIPRVKEMEARIDGMEKALPPIHNFIIPGGSITSSYIHNARSICRRAERSIVYCMKHASDEMNVDEKKITTVIQYLNRLSDFLFVFARFINKEEHGIEIVWNGKNRK